MNDQTNTQKVKLSVKKTLGVVCVATGLGIGVYGAVVHAPDVAIIMGACFGTGLTLFGLKNQAGKIALGRGGGKDGS